MAEISEFERQRQENIQRNKELLRKLNLDEISNSIKREIPDKKPAAKRRKTAPKAKQETPEPSRRSRRLRGVKMENTEEFKQMQEEEEERQRQKKELEKLKQTRLYGNFQLIDLVTDSRAGSLKFEDKVLRNGLKNEKETVVKKEEEPDQELNNEETEIDIDGDNKVLTILRDLGDKFSAGDFYEVIRNSSLEYDDKTLKQTREKFDKLQLYKEFDPLDIKITHQRITTMNFHPSTTDRIVTAGDTTGHVGIWAIDSSKGKEEPAITILKPHGKNVARIITPVQSPSKFLSCSYDGSVREIDLNKLESSEVAYLNDPYEAADYPLGVSDINISPENPNVLYMTTLSGNFYQHDMRTPFKTKKDSLLRLHDKKIGSFSINPNREYQIATASLDRSMRIWDLRSVSIKNAAWSEFESQPGPHMYGAYSSRLSVSCVDWNSDNRLVCNGYDDNICVFDLSGDKKVQTVVDWGKDYKIAGSEKDNYKEGEIAMNLKPFTKIRHNCQTGRWVSIIKSKWQVAPKDGVQKFVIANMNRGFDIYDQKGQIIAHLTDANRVGAVPAVSTLHPTENWCVGGSASDQAKEIGSGSLALAPIANSGFNSSNKVLSCKLKILIPVEVAAATQYAFGEKAKAWTSAVAFKVYKDAFEFKSHKMITPSLPAEAHKDPSGEMVIQEISRDDGGGLFTWRESNGRNPVTVAGEGLHTLTDGVPELDGLVTRSRDDASRVLGDGDRQDVTGVAHKSLGALTGFQVPQSQGLVPRCGQGVLTVGGDGDVGNDVRVALERSLGDTVAVVFTAGQFPGDQGLVSGTRHQQVRVGAGGGEGGDPAVVTF